MGNAERIAREVLRRVSEGSVSRELLDALAGAVLESEEVRLAHAVRDGGPHSVRRAIELAGLLAKPAVGASEGREKEDAG